MKRAFVIMALVLGMCWAQSAMAAEETTTLWCVNMPSCCTFDCVMIDVNTWCNCCNEAPLYVEFLDGQKNLLGTATFNSWGGGYESVAPTDQLVDSDSVCYVQLRKTVDDCCITWLSLRVLCEYCCKGKWKMVYKGCPGCWTPVAVVAPAPVPEPEPKVVPPPVEKPEPVVEREPRFEMPEDTTPEPEPETVVVEGRG